MPRKWEPQIKNRKFQWGSGLNENLDLTGQFIKTQSELPPCCIDGNQKGTEIQEFFRDTDVLITGEYLFIVVNLKKCVVTSGKIQLIAVKLFLKMVAYFPNGLLVKLIDYPQ